MSAELRRLSSELDVGARVHFLGPREHEDVLKAYADADVVALASAHESFGMVAAEAAAAGKAILLTDRCGVAELLGPDGALITPYDGHAVTRGLENLLADVALRRRSVTGPSRWPNRGRGGEWSTCSKTCTGRSSAAPPHRPRTSRQTRGLRGRSALIPAR